MNTQITQQNREYVAQQLHEWLALRNAPQEQIDQMTRRILEGHSDTEIFQTMVTQTPRPGVNRQHPTMFGPGPPVTFETPFGSFPIPAMPPLFMLTVPTAPMIFSPPPLMVSNMFPTLGQQQHAQQQTPSAPNVQTTRTAISGGEIVQQTYSGRHGNATVQYSSSSMSRSFSSRGPLLTPPQHMLANQPPQPSLLQQADRVAPSETTAEPTHNPAQPQPQIQLPDTCQEEQPDTPIPGNESHVRIEQLHDGVLNPDVEARQPQNPRMAEAFRHQVHENTYFSDPPGMPDLP